MITLDEAQALYPFSDLRHAGFIKVRRVRVWQNERTDELILEVSGFDNKGNRLSLTTLIDPDSPEISAVETFYKN